MKKKIDGFLHSRIFVIILILILLLTTLLIGTYAWFTWNSSDNTTFVMTIGDIADIYFTDGNAIEGELYPVFNYFDGLSTSFTVENRGTTTGSGYSISLDITSVDDELISDDVKIVVVKNDIVVEEYGLASLGAADNAVIRLYNDLFSPGVTSYKIYFYIDGNVENDPSMIGRRINGNIIINNEINLVQYVTQLYLNNNPTLITQDTSGDTYYYTSSDVGLMNDGLDATGTWSSGVNDGNIRYYGATPKNYIDIGDRDSSGNVIPWRIIGVFKNMKLEDGTTDTVVKIIRNKSLYRYSFDNKPAGVGSSNNANGSSYWGDARLMMLLNPGYEDGFINSEGDVIYSYEGSLYWNSRGTADNPGKCYFYSNTSSEDFVENNVIDCNFDSEGLSVSAHKYVEDVVWNLGAASSNQIYPNAFYEMERGSSRYDTTRELTWTGKVALMYPSDYGFSADLTKCSHTIGNYSSSDAANCRGTSWILKIDPGYNKLTLTPVVYNSAANSVVIFYLNSGGGLPGIYAVNNSGYVVPTMYLKSNTVISSETDGSSVANALVVK